MKEEYIVDYVFLVQFCEHYKKKIYLQCTGLKIKKRKKETLSIYGKILLVKTKIRFRLT